MASSGLDGELIRVIKRPEPAPALTGLLWIRGSFNEGGHGYLYIQCEVVTAIDAAHTGRFAVRAELFSAASGERIHLPPVVANLIDPHAEAFAFQPPFGSPGFVERIEPAVPLPAPVAVNQHDVVIAPVRRVEHDRPTRWCEGRLTGGRGLRPAPNSHRCHRTEHHFAHHRYFLPERRQELELSRRFSSPAGCTQVTRLASRLAPYGRIVK
jgi:hypothetical protein